MLQVLVRFLFKLFAYIESINAKSFAAQSDSPKDRVKASRNCGVLRTKILYLRTFLGWILVKAGLIWIRIRKANKNVFSSNSLVIRIHTPDHQMPLIRHAHPQSSSEASDVVGGLGGSNTPAPKWENVVEK